MKGIFSDRTFMLLFCAQVLGLLGNGVTIIGLAYFSFEIAGDKASALIGLFYILKMLAFIVVAPFSTNFNRAGSKAAMIGLYLLRAGVVLFLPFSESIWQAVILVIFMHGATAAFVPLMQTVLSDVFSDEGRFTAALGMTRLSYSMEQLVSPLIVSMLLLAVGPFNIFFFAFAGFTVAALILSCAVVPSRPAVIAGPSPWRSTLEGVQIYLATPRLRGLIFTDLAVAIAAATVFLNTVVFVQGKFGLPAQSTALAYGAFGIGAAISSIMTPRLLTRIRDRSAIILAAAFMGSMTTLQYIASGLWVLLPLWFAMGIGYSLALIPAGKVVRRSASYENRPRLFATQVMQAHLCWLGAYVLVGSTSSIFGADVAAVGLGIASILALAVGALIWPADDPEALEHSHTELPADHPHLAEGISVSAFRHTHRFVIDDLHRTWPKPGTP